LTHKSADHCRYRSLRINRAIPLVQLNVPESTSQKVLTWLNPCLLQDNGPAAPLHVSAKLQITHAVTMVRQYPPRLNRGSGNWGCTNGLKYLDVPRGFATLVLSQEMICALTSPSLCLSHLLHHLRYATAHQATFCAQLNPVITSAVADPILVGH
jgi:hypothetical protein